MESDDRQFRFKDGVHEIYGECDRCIEPWPQSCLYCRKGVGSGFTHVEFTKGKLMTKSAGEPVLEKGKMRREDRIAAYQKHIGMKSMSMPYDYDFYSSCDSCRRPAHPDAVKRVLKSRRV